MAIQPKKFHFHKLCFSTCFFYSKEYYLLTINSNEKRQLKRYVHFPPNKPKGEGNLIHL